MVMHGGRALTFAREHNVDYREVLDFSASINPLGPSPKALQAIRDGADLVRVYPDENPVRLIRSLSDRFHLTTDRFLAGNGATELLYFWLRVFRPRTAALVIPTFAEYRKALESVGTAVQMVQLNPADHFRLPAAVVNTEVLIVTNPNNPAGSFTPPEEMMDWISRIPASTQIFIDEAFVEFTAQPSIMRHVERFPNLWVLRSMTKFYALPGLRIGYLVGAGVLRLPRRV